jgi:hypothetical protein
MEEPVSYYDWEQNLRKKKAKKANEPKDTRIINSIGLPHDFFKSYLTLWKSENMKKKE